MAAIQGLQPTGNIITDLAIQDRIAEVVPRGGKFPTGNPITDFAVQDHVAQVLPRGAGESIDTQA